MSRRALLFGSRQAIDDINPVAIAEHCLALLGIACRNCEDSCQPRAIRFRPRIGGHYHPQLDTERCTSCTDCFAVCPVGAIAFAATKPATKHLVQNNNEHNT